MIVSWTRIVAAEMETSESTWGICDGLEGEGEWSVKGDAGGRRGSGLGLAEEEPELVLNITDV